MGRMGVFENAAPQRVPDGCQGQGLEAYVLPGVQLQGLRLDGPF